MAHRLCAKCQKAENPLSRLRFKKSRVDGKVYCENCEPVAHSMDIPEQPVGPFPNSVPAPAPGPSLPRHKPSAGYVVVGCPDCSGGVHRPKQKPCKGCAGYGAVRIEAAMLNVYRPSPVTAPSYLTEG